MFVKPLARLVVIVLMGVFVSFGSLPAFGQCGTYFRSDYHAPNKIGRLSPTGGNFELQDWTGDGRSDFWNFRFNQATQTSDIIIYPALTAGYWDWDHPIIYTTTLGSSATTVNSGCCFRYQFLDFDSDGKMDMLIGDMGGSDYRIHRNIGDGSFAPQAVIGRPGDAGTTAVRHIGYTDVNGDGRLDWIYRLEIISSGEETFYYSAQNADGSFSTPNLILANGGGNEVNDSFSVLGDFDGDGKTDIVYKSSSSPTVRLRVLKNMGGGTFTLGSPVSSSGFNFFGVADLNHDGRQDIYGDGGANLVIFYGQSDASFSFAGYPFSITNSTASVVGGPVDFNGDGQLDLINVDDNDYEVFIQNPGGTFTSHYYPKKLTSSFPSIYLHFEDFNYDGKADLFDDHQDIYNSFGEEVVVVRSGVCDATGQTRAMNFNSDPIPDIVTWNGATGQWKSGNGNWNPTGTTPTQTSTWGAASLGDTPAPGDFDGDGVTDLSVYRNSEGNWYVFLSATSAWSVFHFGLPGDIPIPNDFNGGGKTDYTVFRPSDGNWYVWYSETQSFAAAHFGASGDRPVPADFDGDTLPDIAIFRPSTGDWYIRQSTDQQTVIFHWGATGDIPLPADYDGDSKADYAVYRSGLWYILRSTDGSFAQINWGTTGDIPLPFLEKGEVSVPVVYRPGNSRWYSYRYPIGYALLLSGGTPVYSGLPNN